MFLLKIIVCLHTHTYTHTHSFQLIYFGTFGKLFFSEINRTNY